MKKHDRSLDFMKVQSGHPLSGRCSVCKRVFIAKPKDGERDDDAVLRMRADFDVHSCREDASQSAARIVREATEE